MDIASFEDLLRAARGQPEPQRLLFVFAAAELPGDSTPAERARHAAGEGGALVPLMSVDKDPEELAAFSDLVRESQRFAADWSLVFVAGLAGRDGRKPSGEQADQALQRMIESVKTGSFGSFIPFDRQGRPVRFS
ncbi:MAG: ribonucleotide reductase subunit alpha [Betaproteobacteria bacterium]